MRESIKKLSLMQLGVHEALCVHGTTYRAAEVLGISQPAISQHLKQLRHLFDEELFIRTNDGLIPTEIGYQIWEEAKIILDKSEDILNSRKQKFTPENEKKEFFVAANYISSENLHYIFPDNISTKYPDIKIHTSGLMVERALDYLDQRSLDLFIGYVHKKIPKRFHVKNLINTRYKVLCSKHNKNFQKGSISREDFITMPHMLVSWDIGPSMFDEDLVKQGLIRENVRLVPYNRTAIDIISQTDGILLANPIMIKPHLNKNLKLLEPEFKLPECKIDLLWHRQKDNDPAHVWLREYTKKHILDG